MNVHPLKTWPGYFSAVRQGLKTFEVRLFDRDFKPGDLLVLEEFDPVAQAYSGEVEHRQVTYVDDDPRFGVQQGYCVLGMTAAAPAAPARADPPPPAAGAPDLTVLAELAAHHQQVADREAELADHWAAQAVAIERQRNRQTSALTPRGEHFRAVADGHRRLAAWHAAAAAALRALPGLPELPTPEPEGETDGVERQDQG